MKASGNQANGAQATSTRSTKTARAATPTARDPTGLLELQRVVGNRAVRELLDGAAGADDAGAGAPPWAVPVRLRTPARLQARLAVGPANDEFEREAERVADALMAAPPMPHGGLAIRPASPQIQRRCAECGADGDDTCTCIRRKTEPAAPAQPASAPPDLMTQLGNGQPLDPSTRLFMESRFGTDFGKVRVHSDAAADVAARSIYALAFTTGNDIVFRTGAHRPESTEGRRLIAHELTHVVQQRGNRGLVQARGTVSSAGDAHETEAHQIAAAVARGEHVGGQIKARPETSISRFDIFDVVNVASPGVGTAGLLLLEQSGYKPLLEIISKSIARSPRYIKAELTEMLKDHWLEILQGMAAFTALEVATAILLAIPEPTMATKIAAVALQILTIALIVYFAVEATTDAIKAAGDWWRTCKEAVADPSKPDNAKIELAAKYFAHLIIALINAITTTASGLGLAWHGLRMPEGGLKTRTRAEPKTPEETMSAAEKAEKLPGEQGTAGKRAEAANARAAADEAKATAKPSEKRTPANMHEGLEVIAESEANIGGEKHDVVATEEPSGPPRVRMCSVSCDIIVKTLTKTRDQLPSSANQGARAVLNDLIARGEEIDRGLAQPARRAGRQQRKALLAAYAEQISKAAKNFPKEIGEPLKDILNGEPLKGPGDKGYTGGQNLRSWSLVDHGDGAHMFEKANVKGRPKFSKFDQSGTPRYYPWGTPTNAGQAHLRLHDATALAEIKLGNSPLTDDAIVNAYRKAYADPALDGIKGDLRIPRGQTLASDVTPGQAFDALLKWGGF